MASAVLFKIYIIFSFTGFSLFLYGYRMKKQDNVGIVNSIPEGQLLIPWLDFFGSNKKKKKE